MSKKVTNNELVGRKTHSKFLYKHIETSGPQPTSLISNHYGYNQY